MIIEAPERRKHILKTNNRLAFVDVARGISIICIILGHLGRNDINRIVFTFHIPIFFLITGYFIDTESSKKRFLLKKITSLLIPYFFTSIAIIVLSVIKVFILYDGIG